MIINYQVKLAAFDADTESRVYVEVPCTSLRRAKQTLARWAHKYGVKGGLDVRNMVLSEDPATRRKAFKNDRYDGYVTVTILGG